jgi:magnesium-transporting ATPase (P-type)
MKILQTIIFLAMILCTLQIVTGIWWLEYKKERNVTMKNILIVNCMEMLSVIGHMFLTLLVSSLFLMEKISYVLSNFFLIATIFLFLVSKVLYKLFYKDIKQCFEEKEIRRKQINK